MKAENVEKNVSAIKALAAGVPQATADATLAVGKAAKLNAEKTASELGATRPLWEAGAVAKQKSEIFRDRFGGSPVEVAPRPAVAVINDNGGMDVRTNPAAKLYDKDSLLMESLDPDAAIANQLGFQKGAITINPDGTQATHARPAVPTPADTARPAYTNSKPFGIITPAPNSSEVPTVPRGYEGYDLSGGLPGTNAGAGRTADQESQVQQIRQTQLDKMLKDYRNRQQLPDQGYDAPGLSIPDTSTIGTPKRSKGKLGGYINMFKGS
jgi:hypothetical protein